MSAEKFGRYRAEAEERVEGRKRLAPRNKVKSEKHLETYGGLIKRRDNNENVFSWPNGLWKTLKPRFCIGDLDLPERRKRYTSSRKEEEVDEQM